VRRGLFLVWAAAAIAPAIALAGCGGSKAPSAPSTTAAAPSAPADSLPAGATLQAVSGETGRGAEGATVTVAGRSYSSATGSVTLAERVPLRAELGVVAPEMLERKTLVRDAATVRYTLWPSRSPTGLDEGYTQALVYSRSGTPSPLRRLARGTTRVTVVLSPELLDDQEAVAAHQEAAGRVTAASGGQVVYVLGSQRPTSGVYVEARLDAADPTCTGASVLAFDQDFTRNGEIVRSVMVYCDYRVARTPTVTHELGHSFGLSHSPDKGEVMYAFYNGHGAVDFSPRESLAMRLLLQRPGGNVFPDDDRAVTTSGALQTHVTVCPAGER
jgi:Matrixin